MMKLIINWTQLCGNDETEIWNQETLNFGLCFQKYCLQNVVFSLFAISSAFFIGRQHNFVSREKKRRAILHVRTFISAIFLILSLLQPILQYSLAMKPFQMADILQTGFQVRFCFFEKHCF